MTRARVRLGRLAEARAAEHLAEQGYAIVARNYRCAAGEIDLIARHREAWVFIEVRSRRGRRYGTPEESITPRKRKRLIAAAQTYLQAQHLSDVAWRIDVCALDLSPAGDVLRLAVIENAVQG